MTGGPQRAVLAPLVERGVVLADLTSDVFDDGTEELGVDSVPTHVTTEAAVEVLISWPDHVGYRRVWMPDRALNLQGRLFDGGRAHMMCPTCTSQCEDESADFWAMVRGNGFLPASCPVCNGSLLEWRVTAPNGAAVDAIVEGESEVSGRLGSSAGPCGVDAHGALRRT